MKLPNQSTPVTRVASSSELRSDSLRPSDSKCGCPNYCSGACMNDHCYGKCV